MGGAAGGGVARCAARHRVCGVDPGKVIISAAITGGMTVPTQSTAIPITPEQIVDSALGAHEVGATLDRAAALLEGMLE